jgi:hypothetical protein
VYSNFTLDNKNQYRDVIGTYYSYHDQLIFSINLENTLSSEDNQSICNTLNEMEIESCLSTLTLDSPKTKNNKKRKKFSTTINCEKKFKSKNDSSSINKKTENLNKNQLAFLKNIYEKKIINNILESINTLTSNEQLVQIGLKKIHMAGDGNCFFRGVSHQIYGHQKYHMRIRSQAINYMNLNRNVFEPYLNRDKNPTMEHYLHEMSKNGSYVDHLVITATAAIIEMNIIIHEEAKKPYCVPGSDFIDDQIHLWYNYDPYFPHYDSIKCIDGERASLSCDAIFFP